MERSPSDPAGIFHTGASRRNKGKVVTKRMILEQVWDADGAFVEENTVNVTLNRLKKKIEPDPSDPIYIRNVFGLGYTFGE